MKLIIQPEEGVTSLLSAIDGARKSIEIAIFRFDHVEIRRALERAVDRGVSVHALIANTNHGSAKELRKLEMELLPVGIEVSRTADDLLRHHYKFMVVDHETLFVLTFNFTYLDMDNSRSFGIITQDPGTVRDASKLFHADIRRQPFKPESKNLVVSPINTRHILGHFIKGAKKQLLIYDPEVSDRAMISLLRERAREGVEVRIIGRVVKASGELAAGRVMHLRFHTRTIIRDGHEAFLGSQSLREAELDRRRELGIMVDDHAIVQSLLHVFERDWAAAVPAGERPREEAPAGVRKAAKALVRQLPLAPIVESALKHAAGEVPGWNLGGAELERTLADAVKEAVEDAVSGIVRKSRVA
jgi:cardiolipin synthase